MSHKRLLFYFILPAAVSVFGSCATLLNSEKGAVQIKTEPAGADVFDENNQKLGTTPFDLKTIEKSKETLKITKEGYEDVSIGITRKAKNGFIFLDAMLLCIPCPFDFSSGAVYSMTKIDGVILLRKKLKDLDKSVMISLDKSAIEMPESKEIGRINGSSKKLNDKNINYLIGYPGNSDNQTLLPFEHTYLEASLLSNDEKEKNNLSKPKIILKPVIKDLQFDLKGKSLHDYSGQCSMQCEWNVYYISDKEKTLAKIPVKTSAWRMSGSYTLILDLLLAESSRDLLENDTLYDFLSRVEKQYLVESKGAVFKISAPDKIKYASTKDILKKAVGAVVTVENKTGFGSGVIISKDGYMITNYHVVEDEKHVNVKLNQEIKLNADVIKVNKDYDLALLKISAVDLKTLSFGNSDSAEIGDDVFAIGTPLETSLGQTITKGIISGFREWNGVKFIQTDVSINPGNSGGPLINDKGEIVGIATMKISGKGIEGIGFCIPANFVIEMLNIKFE
jgi:serine protease Do